MPSLFIMLKPGKKRLAGLLIRIFVLWCMASITGTDAYATDTLSCNAPLQTLFFICDNSIDILNIDNFRVIIQDDLRDPMNEIGYCLLSPVDISAYAGKDSLADNPVMFLSALPAKAGAGYTVIVSLTTVAMITPADFARARKHPLVEVMYEPDDFGTFRTILTSKIVENMRMSYICNFMIESTPSGAHVTSDGGHQGITPLEWVFPVGSVALKAVKKGYLPIEKRIALEQPGRHTCYLNLTERRFYHSRLMYPAVLCGLAAAVCYGLDRYYYNEYQSLGEQDFYNNPGRFEDTYTNSLIFERCAQVTLALAITFFSLSFRF